MTNRMLISGPFLSGARIYCLGLWSLSVLMVQLTVGLGVAQAQGKTQGWQQEWEKTVAAAKIEGQLNVYMWSTTGVLAAGVFQKRYPGIKVVGVAGRRGQIEQRILTERRAGKYLADVITHGVNPNATLFYPAKILAPVKPVLVLPEVLERSKWWRKKHYYADPERKYVFVYVGEPQYGSLSYNTKLVDPKTIKSPWDLLDPKWKGKMEARDISTPGPGSGAMRFYYHHPKIGPEFIRRLYMEMDITLFRNPRQGPDWLINGKFHLCFFCSGVTRAKRQGLPVDTMGLMKEGAGLADKGHSIVMLDKAPHPNAAKVFINWFLSREGQTTFQDAYGRSGNDVPNSLRLDVPKDKILPEDRRIEGVDYIELFNPEVIDMKPVLKIYKKALADAKGRRNR